MKKILFPLFLWLLSALSAGAVQAAPTEARLALLIGNAAYKSSPLRNPVNDVRLMEAVLKESGFTVIKAENASMRDMRRLVREFGDRLKASGGVGLFYFAGHGVQVRGENYLISTDSDIRNEDEVADDALNASTVLEKMQTAGNRVNLVILDACRNNPFTAKSRSSQSGLASMRAPGGSLVAYATAPGAVASDGKGRNGLYTEHLAAAIRQPGMPVEEVFKQVRTAVRKESNSEQIPWENTALEGDFFFRGQSLAARPDAGALDFAFWENVKASSNPAEVQAYLAKFPAGTFAGLATARLEQLKAAGAGSPAAGAGAANALGVLELTDTLTGSKRNSPIVATESSPTRIVYSSGDMITRAGEVLQLRVGDHVLRVTSGALWKVPLKEGGAGTAVVEQVGTGFSAPGALNWTATPLAQGKIRVDATVGYTTPNPVSGRRSYLYGSWTALYSNGRELPDSSSASLKGDYLYNNNIVSAEFRMR